MKRSIVPAIVVALLAVFALPALAATKTVLLMDDFFSPKTLSVSKGTTLVFRWAGKAPHNVVVASGPERFRSSTKRTGTYSKRVRRTGSYRIVCTIHSEMKMSLRVR